MSRSPRVEPPLFPFAYDLPQAPKVAVETWIPRLQAVALITALLGSLQGQILGNLPKSGNKATDMALRLFAYSGLCANIGATFSAVLMLLSVTSVPTTARLLYVSCRHSYPRRLFVPNGPPPQVTDRRAQELLLRPTKMSLLQTFGIEPDVHLLRAFGVSRGFEILAQHCLVMFLTGVIFTFVQVAMMAWIIEGRTVGIILEFVVIACLLPPLCMFLFFATPHKCTECSREHTESQQDLLQMA
ncbi:hypothetical protein BKA62DRAFT_707765 [Auriculariales sp. MPI-PUGE-AT-0066]|nr:hypothetical protein BKA62DRAFT_707765 [Auriculariales sp. MPI-PUGE-AT-0066]